MRYLILTLLFISCNQKKPIPVVTEQTTDSQTTPTKTWVSLREIRKQQDSTPKPHVPITIMIVNEVCLETKQTYQEKVTPGYFVPIDNYGNGVWVTEQREQVPGEVICIKSRMDTTYETH